MNPQRRAATHLAVAVLTLASAATRAADAPEVVQIYAAGSLRGVVSDLAAAVGPELLVELKASFGGSGSMRERIENGEHADILLSADVGSPRKLATQGRTALPVIAFARNRICIVSRRDSALTAANLVDRLLQPGVRVKTSAPVVDPGGDYAWKIFDNIDQRRPGSGQLLKDKARALMNVTATPSSPAQSAAAALFASRAVDVSITYCSGAITLGQEMPDLAILPVPRELDPHPVYGMALLSRDPATLRVALYLLSEKGQAILARNGLLPVLDTPASPDP